ncbi:MAG: hypothetical protein ACJ763_14710 [Bdellovibrionia bacterium]
MRPNLKILKALQLTTCVVPLLMTSGCFVSDMQNNTKEMNDTTKEMNEKMASLLQSMNEMKSDTHANLGMMNGTTSDMSLTTREMNGRIESLGKDMSEMKTDTHDSLVDTKDAIKNTYTDMRQNYTVSVRHDMLEMLEKVSVLDAKVAAAGKYIMAYEFQIWKANLNDTPEYRDQLLRDALEEFFLDLARYMPDPNEAPDPTSSKAQMQNLMAISGTIDRVNPSAQMMARRKQAVEPYSFSRMLHEALQKSDQVESGKIPLDQLRPFEIQVLINRDAAIALLQARANFLPVMALTRISDIQRRSLPMQAVMAYVGSTPNLSNLAAMSEALEFISNANEEIRFLKAMRVSPKLNGSLKALYKNMKVPEPGMTAQTQQMSPENRKVRVGVEAALIEQIKKFKEYAAE